MNSDGSAGALKLGNSIPRCSQCTMMLSSAWFIIARSFFKSSVILTIGWLRRRRDGEGTGTGHHCSWLCYIPVMECIL